MTYRDAHKAAESLLVQSQRSEQFATNGNPYGFSNIRDLKLIEKLLFVTSDSLCRPIELGTDLF